MGLKGDDTVKAHSPEPGTEGTMKSREDKGLNQSCRSAGGGRMDRESDHSFIYLKIFLMWTIFKVFIEFVTILLLFCFGFLASRHVGSLAP